jgi:hypothetical protein
MMLLIINTHKLSHLDAHGDAPCWLCIDVVQVPFASNIVLYPSIGLEELNLCSGMNNVYLLTP